MKKSELSSTHRAKLFSALLALDQKQGGWDKVFQLLNEGQRAAQRAQIPELAEQLEQGQTVVLDGLKKTGQFLAWELRLLELGLATGNIRTSYERLRDHYFLQQKITDEIKRQIKLPLMVVFVGIAVVLFWLLWDQQLTLTSVLIRLAVSAAFLYGLVAVSKVIIYRFRFESSPFNAIKRWPFINEVLEIAQSYHYLRNLNQAIDSGLSLSQSLKIAANKIPDPYFSSRYLEVYETVESGTKLSQALGRCGILKGVEIKPLIKKGATAKDAQLHITGAVYEAYLMRLWYWGQNLPQVIYALLPVMVMLCLFNY
jgi:type II secretory pathway component PulF